MKRPIGLWIFWLLGMIINIILGFIFYPLLYMFTQLILFLWITYLIIVALFFPLLIIASIGLLKLRRWGRNIFITITLTMNLPTILLLTALSLKSRLLDFFILDIILIFFTILFSIYFFRPSVRSLFK